MSDRRYFDFKMPSPEWSMLREIILSEDTGISTEGKYDDLDIVHCESIEKIPENWKAHTEKVLENLGIKKDSEGRYYR